MAGPLRKMASRTKKRLGQHLEALGTMTEPDHRTRVAMFHMGRVGSSVLGTDLLDAHSQIVWDGEIFERDWKVNPTGSPVDRVRQRFRRVGHRIYGFEMKILPYQQLNTTGYDLEGWVEVLAGLGFTHWISLYRRNLLRRTISAVRANQSGRYFVSTSKQADTGKVSFPVNGEDGQPPLLERFQLFDACYEQFHRLCEDRPLLKLVYEDDLLEDPTRGYERVCRFTNVKPEAAAPKRARTNPFPVREVLANFDEVAAVLENTRYAWMLDT